MLGEKLETFLAPADRIREDDAKSGAGAAEPEMAKAA
jgi:hypothetical protein